MKVVLISTYELGRQPFGLASPAAWLERSGAQVTCFDLAVETLEEEAVAVADVVAFYVPMHTATRLAIEAFKRIRALNPDAHYCFYGLYAPMNEQFLRKLGAQSIIGGEFEAPLVALVDRLAQGGEGRAKSVVSLDRQKFLVPNRRGLPPLEEYAHLHAGPDDIRKVGYTEATRGCKHLCSHSRYMEASFVSSPRTSCWRTSRSKYGPARSTLLSATPTFSTRRVMLKLSRNPSTSAGLSSPTTSR